MEELTASKSLLVCLALMSLAACGGGSMPPKVANGIFLQSTPANQIAYAAQAPPQNQVSFTAVISYSDGSIGSAPITGAQWSDTDSWVSMQGNVATCLQPAPVLILGNVLSTVTATAQVNGNSYTASSGLYCL
jgi:hypothetical protein